MLLRPTPGLRRWERVRQLDNYVLRKTATGVSGEIDPMSRLFLGLSILGLQLGERSRKRCDRNEVKFNRETESL